MTQQLDYKKDWRPVVALLAERANPKHLSITVTMSNRQPICTSLVAFSIEFTHHPFMILAMYLPLPFCLDRMASYRPPFSTENLLRPNLSECILRRWELLCN